MPKRPVDRGSTADAMTHFNPTAFGRGAGQFIWSAGGPVTRPVLCSEPLVESTLIEAPQGKIIPLINWSQGPVKRLSVTLDSSVGAKQAALASGQPVELKSLDGKMVLILDLEVADVVILR
jgi:hypothetical protein